MVIMQQKVQLKLLKILFEDGGMGLNLPEIKIKLSVMKKGINIVDFISINKILPSKSEARRAIANKGFKINDVTIENEKKSSSVK